MVKALEESGMDVLITSRRYREVEPLIERSGLEVTYVGERGTRGPSDQLVAATRRQAELIPIIQDFGPQVAVSIASAVCARIAFGLRAKHISVNDSPHSEVAGRLTIPLSHHLLCPWVIPFRAWSPFGLRRDQVTTYRALDPAAWLKRHPMSGPSPRLDRRRNTVTVRIQETDAPYMAGTDATWSETVLDALLDAFPDVNLVVLCRYGFQVEDLRKRYGSKCIIPDEVVSGHSLLSKTDLFVGMGGTMNAEASLMGVPTISAFQGSLYTDAYLESVGLVTRALKAKSIVSHARRFLSDGYREGYEKKARRVLDSMEDPVPKIAGFISKTAEQG